MLGTYIFFLICSTENGKVSSLNVIALEYDNSNSDVEEVEVDTNKTEDQNTVAISEKQTLQQYRTIEENVLSSCEEIDSEDDSSSSCNSSSSSSTNSDDSSNSDNDSDDNTSTNNNKYYYISTRIKLSYIHLIFFFNGNDKRMIYF